MGWELEALPGPTTAGAPPGPQTSHAHSFQRPRMVTNATMTLGSAGTGHVTSLTHGALAQAIWRKTRKREREKERERDLKTMALLLKNTCSLARGV